ncbi:dnaJ homolog subfamily B member 5 [Denticeps clupeoides]|uniref:J domain-containing protein n=1 Tax=Denticeps clupeoides TaxID=299321 RepID=A0AAY4ERB8_9TELE|nr:dnaJ homolog subfamily B member 5-like [Denticeps clupeoides]
MVLIWTQFGVKHKNVKCKVRVIHREDSWSSGESREDAEPPCTPAAPAVKDYYAVLGVTSESNEEEIRRAYRRLALRYHPDKNHEEDAEEKFKEIAEAYDVLTDPEKRSLHDQQDVKKASTASPSSKGETSPPFHASGMFFNVEVDSDADFCDLFNPFLRTPHSRPSGPHSNGRGRGAGAEVCELEVSLEELLTGVTKHVRLPQTHALPQERVMSVEVKKGWREGTTITFPGAGLKAGDITFVLKEKKHSSFRREGSNLIYTAAITLREALCGCTVTVPTLDGGLKPLPCSDVIKPGSVRCLRGEGLPRPKNPAQRGDLLVEFQVQFPDRIPPPSKEIIKHSLGQC